MPSSFKYLLHLCLLVLTASPIVAQNAVGFRHLSQKDGLSQSTIFSITQDETGYMWFGTRDGLNKYDGYEFKVYKHRNEVNSLVANDVRVIYHDKTSEQLWVGTTAGLSKFCIKTEVFTNYTHEKEQENSLSSDFVRTILQDTKGRLWIGTERGLNLYKEASNDFISFLYDENKSNSLSDNLVRSIYEDSQGNLWIGTLKGLNRLVEDEKGGFSFERIREIGKHYFSNTQINVIEGDKNGNLWLGTELNGLNYWDRKKQQLILHKFDQNQATSLSHNKVRTLYWDHSGDLWVGTFDGLNLFSLKDKNFTRYKNQDLSPNSLSRNSVWSVFVDKRGSLWVGTYYGGINFLDKDNNQFINLSQSPYVPSLSGNVVSCFAQDKNLNYWIGTDGSGLNFFNRTTRSIKSYQFKPDQTNGISGDNIKKILIDGDKLWIGTYNNGLNLLDIPSQKFTVFKPNPNDANSLSNSNVFGLLRERHFLWILTYGGGLDIYDLNQQKFHHFKQDFKDPFTYKSNLTRAIFATKNKDIWIGTENGLDKVVKDKRGFPKSYQNYLEGKKIYAIQEGRYGNLWIGTFTNGLFSLNPINGEIRQYTVENGLPSNTIFGILEDESNQLWLSTNNGLSRFSPIDQIFTNYNLTNGLKNSEYLYNAYYKSHDGQLFFGGTNGFTYFNPEDIHSNKFIPPIVLTDLQVQNKTVKVGDSDGILKTIINDTEELVFNYNKANFSISFAALDYYSPDNNQFAHQLEGLDNDWIYTKGKSTATYTIQTPGTYLFKLKGANSDGVWNPIIRQISITVLPPFWLNNWAYLLYFLVLGTLSFWTIRFLRLRNNLKLEQFSKQKQEELHQIKMRFFTNITHEFRTPLTLILGQLEEILPSHAQQTGKNSQKLVSVKNNAQRLLNLVNQLLTFRKLETDHLQLKVVEQDMNRFAKEVFCSFKESAKSRNIDYQFISDGTEIEAWFDAEKMEKVLFNLLSNAFKFTADSGFIKMSVERHKKVFCIKVRDNGLGIDPVFHREIFKRFYELDIPVKRTLKGSGIGLAISKEMVALHKGQILVESKKGKGATFIVQLPLGNSHFKKENISLEKEKIKTEKTIYVPQHIMTSPINEVNDMTLGTTKNLPKTSQKLLIVEDDSEVRAYLQSLFQADFKVELAENGEIGLKKANKFQPDLILSDVMMPLLDGISFCQNIKSNIKTSHIPVILLTASTSSENRIEGLKSGADDYITKPFNPKELQLKVQNLLNARLQIKDKFARILNLEPRTVTISSADENFLKNAMDVIEKHIENPDFSINQFAYELAVSRPLLFRKIKAITNLTPNNFIKTIRLKRAAQILGQKKLNVAEIAYKVGFKNPRYFSKCFQKQFAQTPSEYMVGQT